MVVQHTAQQFTWEGFGLKLHIYEDCLPAGMEQCSIHIKTSVAGLYEFSENTHPVSPVFWLHCIPECNFCKSIGLEIQHCGKPTGDSRLSFASHMLPKAAFKDIGDDFAQLLWVSFMGSLK